MRKIKKYWLSIFILLGVSILLNLLAFWKSFTNFYADHIYPFFVNLMGPLNNWSKVAIGEILMYFAILVVIVEIITAILLIFRRKKDRFVRHAVAHSRFTLFLATLVFFVFTVMWLVPIRADEADTQNDSVREYTFSDLEELRNYLVLRTDWLALQVERNEDGSLKYDDAIDTAIIEAMRQKSDVYPRLSGYYGRPKYALCSDFLEWSGIGGFTYVYTKEVTLNRYTSDFYYPTLYSHELAHYKGFFKESEANFLSFITMNESGNALLAYSACAEMLLQYVEEAYQNSYEQAFDMENNFEAAQAHYYEQPGLFDLVRMDITASYEAAQKRYAETPHPAESISEVVSEVSDYGWEAQDAILQEDNYDGVVRMLLEYYWGRGFLAQ